jgi:hypothetical protein
MTFSYDNDIADNISAMMYGPFDYRCRLFG